MLSKRLKEVSKFIDENKVVYDVGSDHGLLPCFLVLEKGVSKAYASDNKEGPLNKAKANIKKYHLEGKVIPVLCDGIDKIGKDVDIITICGMGFYTVKHILDNKDLKPYEKIIVQVNKNVKDLRKWIDDNDYSILDEEVVHDDFYYEIVVFNASKSKKLSKLEIEYGPINLKKRTKTFIEYLKDQRKKLNKINVSTNMPLYCEKIAQLDAIIKGDFDI